MADTYIGKGLREPCDPFREFMFYGVPTANLPPIPGFNCAPVPLGATTVYDLGALAPGMEVIVGLVTFTNVTGNIPVTIRWYRARDDRLLYEWNYLIPNTITWSWYYVYSYIGYYQAELWENGDYYVTFEAPLLNLRHNFIVIGAKPEPTPQGPHGVITDYKSVAQAKAGESVPYEITVLNDGDQAGTFAFKIKGEGEYWSVDSWSAPATILPGASQAFSGAFSMPDLDVAWTFDLQLWSEVYYEWFPTGDQVTYSTVVAPEELSLLALPASILNLLESSWYNFPRGSWINVSVLGVGIILPPFSFTPGWWVRDSLNWVIDGINWVIGWVQTLFSIANGAWDLAWSVASDTEGWFDKVTSFVGTFLGEWWTETLEEVINRIGEAVDAVQAALGIRIGFLEDWADTMKGLDLSWETIYQNVSSFLVTSEPFATMIGGFNRLVDVVDALPGEMWDFFSNPAAWIFDKIDDWLNELVE